MFLPQVPLKIPHYRDMQEIRYNCFNHTAIRLETRPNIQIESRSLEVSETQSCKMSQLWRIYLCKKLASWGKKCHNLRNFGKVWFENFDPCKRIDILQLCSESWESRSLGSLGSLRVLGVSESQTMNCTFAKIWSKIL